MGIYAVSVGNVICFLIATALNTLFALRFVKIKKGLANMLPKTAVLVAVLLAAVSFLVRFMPENRWWVLLSGTIAVFLYAILVFGLKFFDKDDIKVFNKENVG